MNEISYSMDDHSLPEESLVSLLRKNHWTICTAESCTGGKVSAKIVNVSGASEVFEQGFITYANSAKEDLLGVSPETLKLYGAVSEQTAEQMCYGAMIKGKADVGIAVTGIAGPGGGTPEKPVGLVYISCCVKGKITVKKCLFSGNREMIREQSALAVLSLAVEEITEY